MTTVLALLLKHSAFLNPFAQAAMSRPDANLWTAVLGPKCSHVLVQALLQLCLVHLLSCMLPHRPARLVHRA